MNIQRTYMKNYFHLKHSNFHKKMSKLLIFNNLDQFSNICLFDSNKNSEISYASKECCFKEVPLDFAITL